MTSSAIYTATGVFLFSIGLAGILFSIHVLRKILAVNVAGSGVFLVLVSLARGVPGGPPDSLPHALVLTGIVVAVSATAVALALYGRLRIAAEESDPTPGPRS